MENNNGSEKVAVHSGYDVAVIGLENGTFYTIHIPALICISASFICAVIAIVLSFKRKHSENFFTQWSKSERFVVYLAICDGLFNIAHFTDHMHIVIVKDHVYPKELCEFYGFTLAMFITAQHLVVNIVAINAFMLIYFEKHLNFGRWDWRMLAWTFGAPFVGATIAAIAGQLGPNGAFCYFDAVKANVANIFFTTVPLLLIVVINVVLYILTWKRIYEQTSAVRKTFSSLSASMRASHRAARAMSLFVLAFFIQWWAMALYGLWSLINGTIVPQQVFHFVTTFSNIGGCLNLVVYLIIKRKKFYRGEQDATNKHSKRIRSSNGVRESNDGAIQSSTTSSPVCAV